jgi:ABC-2 type transport system ATP-binding protein
VNRSPHASEEPAIAASGLVKSFGDRLAVDGVDLVLRPGRIHGLLGPNGAGKTTVLRMLLGLVRPEAGSVEVARSILPATLPRGRVGIAGFVDTPRFYPYLTASRNLELLSAWDGPQSHARVEDLLELVGLADRAQSKVRGFSTGMRQRLGLAAALISEPAVLIVDEPTSGLDPAAVRDVHALLLALAGAGRTVLISSHDLEEVERLCTDVTVLREGRVAYAGSIASLRERAGRRVWELDTSDNDQAALLASHHRQVTVDAGPWGALKVTAEQEDLDGYLLALAGHGIVVRELHRDELSFETLYFQLTEPHAPGPHAQALA